MDRKNFDDSIDTFMEKYILFKDLDIKEDNNYEFNNKSNVYYHTRMTHDSFINTSYRPSFFSKSREYSLEYVEEYSRSYLYTCELNFKNPFDCSTEKQIQIMYDFEDWCFDNNIKVNQDGINRTYKNHILYFTVVDDMSGAFYFYNWMKDNYPEYDCLIITEGIKYHGENILSYVPLNSNQIKIIDIEEINA